MNYILFDDQTRQSLLPFTFTRPVCEIRIGILTIREKWEWHLKQNVSFFTEKYLREKYHLHIEDDNVLINGSVIPDDPLVDEIRNLKTGEKLKAGSCLVAWRINGDYMKELARLHEPEIAEGKACGKDILKVNYSWDIFSKNKEAIDADFVMLTKGKKSQPISKTNHVINPENIFLEEGAKVECAVLNATDGYIYIGKNAEVMEGALVRGAFSLGEGAQLRMGARVYGPTTVGPHCRVGGEVTRSVLFGYSNKAHDGFLGDSVIGEWCNLGADTNTSNLKNNYSSVKMWNYKEEDFIKTGLQFCGLMMADHSKCSINTMFNTGTVVGVSANIFGHGFPPKFIPSFSWGGSEGFDTYRLEDASAVAQKVFERRGIAFDNKEKNILKHLFDYTTVRRAW
jgi:UDP-N-acetylglucosamine diphosphorylase/glucosamine-1-phosphate N-acetyltransferase